MKCPCTKDCKHRTATCKMDGSCPNGFAEYERQRMNYYKEQDDARKLNFRAQPAKRKGW